MNQVIENIHNRRSVRSYEDKPISDDLLRTLIEAANAAPSGSNMQPWRFVVVKSSDFKKKLAEKALPRYKKWIAGAPPVLQEMRKEIDARTSDPVYYNAAAIVFVIGKGMSSALDCPMACQNIMLAARSLGIGSCWVYFGQLPVADDAEVRSALDLTEGEAVYGPILLGYPKGDFPPTPPKKPPVVKYI